MTRLRTQQSTTAAILRLLLALLLAVSMVAPKVSLAASLLLGGEGYRTVVICSGSQLLRVTIAPDGEVVTDPTLGWVTPDCVLTDQDVRSYARRWQRISYPDRFVVAQVPELRIALVPVRPGLTRSIRGPPLG